MNPRAHWLLLPLTLLVPLASCKKDEQAAGAAGSASAIATPNVEAAIKGANKELSDLAKFDKEMGKKGCDVLTRAAVAKTFGVAADALKQMKIMGCIYSWSEGDQTLEARVTMLRAHKSEKSAATWFKNATQNKTAEQEQAVLDQAMKT